MLDVQSSLCRAGQNDLASCGSEEFTKVKKIFEKQLTAGKIKFIISPLCC
jgi:hypothetical protein